MAYLGKLKLIKGATKLAQEMRHLKDELAWKEQTRLSEVTKKAGNETLR